MTVKIHAAAAQLLAALALIGCSGGGPGDPTPPDTARADYARIAGAAGNLESVVKGNAVVSVRLGQPDLRADVTFTGLANEETGTRYSDMAWRGMTVSGGAFGHRGGAGDRLEGRFFGPRQEEAGGVFERAGIAGAFGAKRGTE